MHEILLTYDAFISAPGPEHGITVDRLLHAGSRCGVSEVGGGTSAHCPGTRVQIDANRNFQYSPT